MHYHELWGSDSAVDFASFPAVGSNVSKPRVSATVGRPVATLNVSSKGHQEARRPSGLRVELSHKKTTFR
jgi:hypothetical protein